MKNNFSAWSKILFLHNQIFFCMMENIILHDEKSNLYKIKNYFLHYEKNSTRWKNNLLHYEKIIFSWWKSFFYIVQNNPLQDKINFLYYEKQFSTIWKIIFLHDQKNFFFMMKNIFLHYKNISTTTRWQSNLLHYEKIMFSSGNFSTLYKIIFYKTKIVFYIMKNNFLHYEI